ncbi:MAG: imidazole glycerol phosphate synthase subunit HisH [Gammaproteobacteria bacterium]|nr:imidazole glycerol phosphate synthase subunit HisH [Gammaproteobacteria bacterium]
MHHIAVIDYGMGNLRSVSKALETVSNGIAVEVTSDPARILAASHVVFPGVGAIRDCIAELARLNLDDVIRQVIANGTPFLGICLGMQALLTHSEENSGIDCLDIFAGNVRHFELATDEHGEHLKVPHMGWNQVHQTIPHPLWKDIDQDSRFYFVHSYYVDPKEHTVIAASSDYPETFTCAIHKDNVFAVQFHPEKSQHAGLKLLENFIAWDGHA